MPLRVLFAAMSMTLLGQTQTAQYDEIKSALGLTDAQLVQLQQNLAAPVRRPAPGGNPAPTPLYPPATAGGFSGRIIQPAQNQAALRVLDDSQRAKLAEIRKALDRSDQASFAIEFGLMKQEDWPGAGLCVGEGYNRYLRKLGLREDQVQELDRLRLTADQKTRRDQLFASLSDAQKEEGASFQTALTLAREAIRLKLIFAPRGDPPLCH